MITAGVISTELSHFLAELYQNPILAVSALLTLGVILVNGWTDAPNAIATCVSTRAMGMRAAVVMAAVFNLLGVLVMTALNSSVAMTIYHMVDFGENSKHASIALCAAMSAIVIWATAAWYFGIPTSESHALIAGLSGAAIAIQNSLSGIRFSEWGKVLYGMFFSVLLGFGFGFLMSKLTEMVFSGKNRMRSERFFSAAQVVGGAGTAFMHGAQDGQKFIAVFLLGESLASGVPDADAFSVPIWLMLLCALLMGIGTSIGGYRIIRSVGMDLVALKPYQGFAADAAATGCLLISSLTGIPVSTTHTKTTAIMGVGAARRFGNVNWGIVKDLFLAWFCTFPGCGLLGFGLAKLFLRILG